MTAQENSGPTGQEVYDYKVDTGRSWREVAQHFGLTMASARSRARNYHQPRNLPSPGGPVNGTDTARIIGGMDHEPRIDPAELWQRAEHLQRRRAEKAEYKSTRRVIYDRGPVILVWMGDLHLGNAGTDYLGLGADLRYIEELAEDGHQVGVVLMGDMLDNFIIGKLKSLRINQSPFTAIEEWGLVEYALVRLAPFLIGGVSGNHDNWTYALSGIDYLRDRHRQLTPGILYDEIELAFTLQVGDYETRVMCRHAWRGASMYNPTHGIEHKHHTMGRLFDIGVGGHTHRGGLAREMPNGDRGVGHAIIVGTYKEEDTYARRIGFPPSLETSAVATVVDETGILFSTSNLYSLARLLG